MTEVAGTLLVKGFSELNWRVQNIQGSMKERKDDRRLTIYKDLNEIFVVLQYKGSWFFRLILVSQVNIFFFRNIHAGEESNGHRNKILRFNKG